MKKLIVLAALLAVAACTNPNTTRRVAETMGYTQVEITGYEFFGCSEDDTHRTGFRARGTNGQAVTGQGCSGLFKGTTIRYD